jgi:hypothetical protein
MQQHIKNRLAHFVVGTKKLVQLKEPPQKISIELAGLEALAEYQMWLRGVMCFLALFSFTLSLITIEDVAISAVVYALISIISLVGEVTIYKVYVIKAAHAGLSNPVYRHRPSIIHSPNFFQMLFEMLLWALHCPPGIEALVPWAYALNFIIVLRFYVFVLYLNNSTFAHRIFCRAMSTLAKLPLDTSFYIRTSFAYQKTRSSVTIITFVWTTLALLFSKAENITFGDSLYFLFVTAATIGYGDIVPYTTVGRFLAFAAWLFGLTIVGWVVGMMHEGLSLTEAETNLFMLFRANELCNLVPEEAAIVIQRWWRINRNRRKKQHIFLQNIGAYFFTKQCFAFRSYRRELRQDEASFVNSMSMFRDSTAGAGAVDPEAPHSSLPREQQLDYAALVGALDNRLARLESTFSEIERLAETLGG